MLLQDNINQKKGNFIALIIALLILIALIVTLFYV